MALMALEKVRGAEVSARSNVEHAEKDAEEKVLLAKKQAQDIIGKASEKALSETLSKEDRARKKADEILVTAHNSSLLLCEELKRRSQSIQEIVNTRILKLISQI